MVLGWNNLVHGRMASADGEESKRRLFFPPLLSEVAELNIFMIANRTCTMPAKGAIGLSGDARTHR